MEELKITKEKVLEAASKCETAKEILRTIFPDVFTEPGKIRFSSFKKIQSDNGDRLIEMRATGDSSCVWLGKDFNWTIEEAPDGGYLLTPIRKLP